MQRMKSKHGMIWYFDMKCWQSQLIQMSWHVKTVMKYIRSLWKVSVKKQQQTSFMWITLKRCWKYRKCSISQKERVKFLDFMLSLNIMKRNTRSELHEICQSFLTDHLWKNASEILWQKHKYILILVPLLFINTIHTLIHCSCWMFSIITYLLWLFQNIPLLLQKSNLYLERLSPGHGLMRSVLTVILLKTNCSESKWLFECVKTITFECSWLS